jgi:hypothetical protein
MVVEDVGSKVVVMVAPSTATGQTAETALGILDCIGWEHAKLVYLPALGTTTGPCATVLSLGEGTGSTAFTAIVPLVGGTATSASVGFVCGNLSTAENVCVVWDLDLRERERYLELAITPGEEAAFAAIAILSRGREEPVTNALEVNHLID